MSLQEFVLHPTDRPSLAFQGRVVAHAEAVDNPTLDGRSYCLTVYESESGELHVSIEYRSSCELEASSCVVECDVDMDDISEVLLVYDATMHLCERDVPARSTEEWARFRKQIYGHYDDLCAEIEAQMRRYQPPVKTVAEKVSSHDAATKSPAWRRWIPIGKPR